jgi:hypothetical protein
VHDATGVWEVGDRVEVIFGNNAFGKYFPGVVHKVHEELPLANKRHWFADKAVALYYLCCCHVSKQRPRDEWPMVHVALSCSDLFQNQGITI